MPVNNCQHLAGTVRRHENVTRVKATMGEGDTCIIRHEMTHRIIWNTEHVMGLETGVLLGSKASCRILEHLKRDQYLRGTDIKDDVLEILAANMT
jgi:hypothetical protein